MLLWIVAIRNSFVSLLPLTFFRVTVDLILYLPWPQYQQWMANWFGSNWKTPLTHISQTSFDLLPLFLVAIISVQLTYRYPHPISQKETTPPLMVGISAIINFLIVLPLIGYTALEFSIHSMLSAIIIGIATAELMAWSTKQKLLDLLHLPVDSDTTFYNAMRMAPSIVFIGTLFFLVGFGLTQLTQLSEWPDISIQLTDWAHQSTVYGFLLNLGTIVVKQGFWFLGIHGGLALNSFANDAAFLAELPDISINDVTRVFVYMGGSGATVGLIIAIFIVTKNGIQNKLAKISVIPSIFNINDLLIYGLPIVLNPLYLVPFFLTPLLLMLMALVAIKFGFITLVSLSLPWTTPPLISGWMITQSWQGVFLQLIGIVISTLIYLPFVRKVEVHRKEQQQLAFEQATHTIIKSGHSKQQIIARQDKVGMIARDLVIDLRKAINRNELSLVYQPKHSRSGNIVGVEALIRWTHPRYGFVSPAMLIMLAEDSGVIHKLGRWVFEQSCACKAQWNDEGHRDLTMAVNISPVQLTDTSLPNFLKQCMQKYGLEPHELELEITESSEIPDSQLVDAILQEISDIGIHLAMDDFGMGYSSLLHLRRFKVNAIKIDGSITRDVLTNSTNADIVRTISALGKAQQVCVVAEYVETQEQREALVEMGCDIFQGYYHSPPLKFEECLMYFLSHRYMVVE